MFLVRKQYTQRSEGDEVDMSRILGIVVIGQREPQEQRPEYVALFLFLQKIKIKTETVIEEKIVFTESQK